MKVLFLDTVHPILRTRLEEEGWQCKENLNGSKEEVKREIPEFDGIVIRSRIPMDEDLLSNAKKLRFIARSGAGMENIDIDICESMGIELFNAPEGNRDAVGEHAIGMLLSLLNHFCRADREVRTGVWEREGNRGKELGELTVGIIGFGNTGSAFAEKLKGFGCRVLAYDKYKNGFSDEYVEEVDLSKIQQQADVISFHVPLRNDTRSYFDHLFLEKLEKTPILINTSRGEVVRIEAIVRGLEEGRLNGACLDVLEHEKSSFEDLFEGDLPTDLKTLMDSDKVLFSPHVAGWTEASYRKLSEVLAMKILDRFGNHKSTVA